MNLQIKNIKHFYNGNCFIQYNDFSIQLGIMLVHGTSGSGKTTLLHSIYRIKNYSGKILWNDTNIAEIPIDYYYKNIVSIVFQGGITSHHFTITDYFTLFKQSGSNDKNQELLQQLELNALTKQPIEHLSGGQKYKTAILIAILKNTPIILLDEPTAHLDSQSTHTIISILENLAKNKIILIATHDNELLKKKELNHYFIQRNALPNH